MKIFKLFSALLAINVLAACEPFDPFTTEFAAIEPAVKYQSKTFTTPPNSSPTSIKAISWNIKFGGARIDMFFDCHGDRVLMSETEVLQNMQALASAINTINPDVIFLQEVDVLSKRTAYVNQVQWLLDNTQMNYGAYASQWKADFVPSDGLGRVDSGSAILSRWPLNNAKRYALPKISEQSALTRYFYLKRNYIKADITPKTGSNIDVLTLHTSAFSQDGTKKQQLDIFLKALDDITGAGRKFLFGGDLNELPPNSTKTSNFPDSVCTNPDFQADDYSQETDWLQAFYDSYTPAISLANYQADNSPYFTHTTDKNGFWNRKVDYLFTNASLVANSSQTYQSTTNGGIDTMPLGDHAPVKFEVMLP